MRIVVTGGAGSLAGDILPGLAESGHEIWAVDHVPATEPSTACHGRGVLHRVTARIGDPRDQQGAAALAEAAEGAGVIIHLAGIPLEDEWEELLQANISVTQTVLKLAAEAGVPRVVLASSIHAAGFTGIPEPGHLLPADIPQNPNTLYGSTKAAGEALAKYYVNHFGIEVLNVRICSRTSRPADPRMLSTWLSPADAVRLFRAAVSAPLPEPFWTIWGVSANSRGWFDPEAGEAIGFLAQDDAEAYASELLQGEGPTADASHWERTIGGIFSSPEPPRMKGRNG